MIPVALRLKALREKAGVSVRSMAERVGKPASSYAHYENPEKFKADFLPLKLAQSFAQALDKEGFADDVLALAGVSGLSVSKDMSAAALVGPAEAAVANDTKLVTVYDVAASAGGGALAITEEMVGYKLAFPQDYLKNLTHSNLKNLAIISVKGDSMEPTLHDDDVVMLDFSKCDLNYDGLFVLRFGETLHVKRVARSAKRDHIKIISDNRDIYPAEDIHLSDVDVVGKVIWKGGKV